MPCGRLAWLLVLSMLISCCVLEFLFVSPCASAIRAYFQLLRILSTIQLQRKNCLLPNIIWYSLAYYY